MREIKFRAWDGKHKRFGYIHVAPYGISYPDNLWRGFKSGERGANMVDVDDIQQFTGLLDKNGKEIYEGDIVRWGDCEGYGKEDPIRIARVEINPDIRFIIVNYKNSYGEYNVFEYGCFAYKDTYNWVTVIGNIHEHPELLKESKSTKVMTIV